MRFSEVASVVAGKSHWNHTPCNITMSVLEMKDVTV